MSENQIVIIGAGPAGLMAAQTLAEKGFKVHIYEFSIGMGPIIHTHKGKDKIDVF